MKISRHLLLGSFCTLLILNSLSVFADNERSCSNVEASFGYRYNGTTYTAKGSAQLAETGFFNVTREGNYSGEGQLAFYFSDFTGRGPLWLLLHEIQSDGKVMPDESASCTGTVDFLATATVIKTSNPNLVPEGTVLFADSPRSLSYTLSGRRYEIIDFTSTSPGTIGIGTGQKQGSRWRKFFF